MDRWTKTDLRRAPHAPRNAAPRPAPTSDEEQALLFGEMGDEPQGNIPSPPFDRKDEDAEE